MISYFCILVIKCYLTIVSIFTLNKFKKIKICGIFLLRMVLVVISISIGIIYNNNINNHLQSKRHFNEIEFTVKSSLHP